MKTEQDIKLLDINQRLLALDVNQSFIVQAPAGSGKTSLLTQRYLALLAYKVNAPEECLAITFTRKAALEMKNRVINSLVKVANGELPTNAYEKTTYDLAKKVLIQDKLQNWELIANPNRLKIQTIDALAMSITKRMPVATSFGAQPDICEDPRNLYKMAVDDLFANVDIEQNWSKALENILIHLNNDWDNTKNLLIDMLGKRDQWLNIVVDISKYINNDSKTARDLLEEGLKLEITNTLDKLVTLAPKDLTEIITMARFAAKNLMAAGVDSKIQNCKNLEDSWPGYSISELPVWQGIAELLLTKTGSVRKNATKNQGFLSIDSSLTKEEKSVIQQMKNEMRFFLEELANNGSYKEFIDTLQEATQLPNSHYEDTEWKIIAAIVTILPVLVSFLQLVFQKKGQVDFTEVTLAADRSLGDELEPTDLALYLGYRINHLLIDEFQDTSIPQFNLIKKLTTSWQVEEGRTLFLVGDPQQSIYAFRKAEVGLFLLVKKHGIGSIPVKSLTLSTNFRSHNTIVEWFNKFFIDIFPKKSDFATGSIVFSPSDATNFSGDIKSKVEFIDTSTGVAEIQQDIEASSEQITNNDILDVNKIIEIIKAEKQYHPTAKIAILVRSRSHLLDLIPALKQNNIAYQGTEIESLSLRPIVRDLLSLTKAILHLGDRISWLAILRAPFCGLTLEDLHIIATAKNRDIVWENLLDKEVIELLTSTAKAKVAIIINALKYSLDNIGRVNLRDLVCNTWIKLNGERYLELDREIELAAADNYFDFLGKYADSSELLEIGFLDKKLSSLYAKSPPNNNNPVEIMTIHRSKGLEFDTVILPFLHKKSLPNSQQLFLWQERVSANNTQYLLFSPIKSAVNKENSKYKYIKSNLHKREQMEARRILYVAVTRTKYRLYCLANFSEKVKGSFLGMMA